VLVLAGLVLDEDDGCLVGVCRCVPIDTVDRYVEAPAAEPNELPRPVFFEHTVRLVEPVELIALLTPELFALGEASLIEALVLL